MEYFFLLDKYLPEGVGIEMYGPEHIAWLAAGVVICALLCILYRRMDKSGRRRLGLAVSGSIIFLEAFRIAAQIICGVFNVHYLPFHLCGLAVYFTIIHALSGNELLGEVLYGICMPSAVCALVFPDWIRYPILNMQSIQSFLVHILLASYPLMRIAGGDMRPNAKRLPRCLLFILAFAVPMYFLNKLIGTNFFFLNWPSPGSPLELFAGPLGNPGYILGYIPMLGAVWLILYLPIELARRIKKT